MAESTVQVKNLYPQVDVYMLCNVMKIAGRILKAEIAIDAQLQSLGVGYVVFDSYASAYKAVAQLNGLQTDIAKPLVVMVSNDTKKMEQYTNLYVKNFNNNWDDLDLEFNFRKFGKVQHAEVALDDDGKSKGFGFVNFMSHTAAESAVKLLHGKEVDGTVLYVQPHVKKEVRGKVENTKKIDFEPMKQNPMRQQHNISDLPHPPCNNLKVNNLPFDFSESELISLFGEFGHIESIKMPSDEFGKSKGYGFVNFKEKKAADKAYKVMNGYFLHSKRLNVNYYQNTNIDSRIAHHNWTRNEAQAAQRPTSYKSNKLYSSSGALQHGVRPKEIFAFKGNKKAHY